MELLNGKCNYLFTLNHTNILLGFTVSLHSNITVYISIINKNMFMELPFTHTLMNEEKQQSWSHNIINKI